MWMQISRAGRRVHKFQPNSTASTNKKQVSDSPLAIECSKCISNKYGEGGKARNLKGQCRWIIKEPCPMRSSGHHCSLPRPKGHPPPPRCSLSLQTPAPTDHQNFGRKNQGGETVQRLSLRPCSENGWLWVQPWLSPWCCISRCVPCIDPAPLEEGAAACRDLEH